MIYEILKDSDHSSYTCTTINVRVPILACTQKRMQKTAICPDFTNLLQPCQRLPWDAIPVWMNTEKRTVYYQKIDCSENFTDNPKKNFRCAGAPSASETGFCCARFWLLCLLSAPLAFTRLWYHEKREERKGETSRQAHTRTHTEKKLHRDRGLNLLLLYFVVCCLHKWKT